MEHRIIAFFAAVMVTLWLLSLFPRSKLSMIAFTWIGPEPLRGESWMRYQLRWAFYSLDWCMQCAALLLLLYLASNIAPGLEGNQVFLMFAAFALPICIGMALLATITFALKAAKARIVGPNPIYGVEQWQAVT